MKLSPKAVVLLLSLFAGAIAGATALYIGTDLFSGESELAAVGEREPSAGDAPGASAEPEPREEEPNEAADAEPPAPSDEPTHPGPGDSAAEGEEPPGTDVEAAARPEEGEDLEAPAAEADRSPDDGREPAGRSPVDAPEGDTADRGSAETSSGDLSALAPAEDEPAGTRSQPISPPTFDLLRVEPTGDLVAAGRGSADVVVDLMLGDDAIASTASNMVGDWTLITDEPLPAGEHELVLRARDEEADSRRQPVFGDTAVVAIDEAGGSPLVVVTPLDGASRVVQLPQEERQETAPGDAQTADSAAAQEEDGDVAMIVPDASAQPEDETPDTDAATSREAERAVASETAPSGRADDDGERAAEQPASTDGEPMGQAVVAADDRDGEGSGTRTPARAGAEEIAEEERAEGGAPQVVIETVEVEDPDRLMVAGIGPPEAVLRLYVNNRSFGDTRSAESGRWIASGRVDLPPGRYEVRADLLDAEGGVAARSEVRFDRVRLALEDESNADGAASAAGTAGGAAGASGDVAQDRVSDAGDGDAERSGTAAIAMRETGDAASAAGDGASNATAGRTESSTTQMAATAESGGEFSSVINIERGDNLWRIARALYGRGIRYTVIYEANRNEIRDPDLIYPGQVFTIPVLDDESEQPSD